MESASQSVAGPCTQGGTERMGHLSTYRHPPWRDQGNAMHAYTGSDGSQAYITRQEVGKAQGQGYASTGRHLRSGSLSFCSPCQRQQIAWADPEPMASSAPVDIASLELEAQQLASMYGQGKMSLTAFMVANDGLQARIDAAKEIPAYQPKVYVPSDIRKEWEGMSLGDQRAYIVRVLGTIIISPAVKGRKAFDPNRVTWSGSTNAWRSGFAPITTA